VRIFFAVPRSARVDLNLRRSHSAAAAVDCLAPAFPEWEPDALYAALRGGRP